VRLRTNTAATLLLMGAHCLAARLSPPAELAFNRYVARLETRLAGQHASPKTYLAVLNMDAGKRVTVERQLMSGEIRIEPVNGGTWPVSGGLLHHWRGAAFVPSATPKDMLALLRDYDHLSSYYAPQVVSSHALTDEAALTDEGDAARLIVRFKERAVLTVVLDTEYDVRTGLTGNNQGYEFSRSTHIWEIDEPGTAHERRLPEGDDDGFLWRLNSYWSFARIRNGLLIECEAVSLTRDVPIGLGWLITPMIEELPRSSLEFTLRATKNALATNVMKERR
jgi:hypothetical protein